MATGEQLKRVLTSIARMSPENWLKFREELLAESEAEDDQGFEGDPEYEFSGKPAMDSKAMRGFARRYPEAKAIKTAGFATDARSPEPVSARAINDFYTRYPEAKRGA